MTNHDAGNGRFLPGVDRNHHAGSQRMMAVGDTDQPQPELVEQLCVGKE